MQEFKYELGISFLSKDEKLAERLNEELKLQVSTYFYKEHEKKQVFQDAVELYDEIFSQQVRFSIILYRDGWGDKGITSVEKRAIKSVLIDDDRGIDFILLVSLDGKRPRWWGDKISFNYEESKFNSLVEVILHSYKRIGGEINDVDPIKKIQRQREIKKKKDEKLKFLNQINGRAIQLMHDEFTNLIELFKVKLEELGSEVSSTIEDRPISYYAGAPAYLIYNTQTTNESEKFRVYVYLKRTNINSVEDSLLYIYAGHQTDMGGNEPPSNKIFKFTVDDDLNPGWELINDDATFYSSKEVLNFLFVELHKHLEKIAKPKDNAFFIENMYIGGGSRSRDNRL
jgi:hypothetical protein